MKSYMQKKETVERKWYVIDAEGKPLGPKERNSREKMVRYRC